jgi:hypothetical protein
MSLSRAIQLILYAMRNSSSPHISAELLSVLIGDFAHRSTFRCRVHARNLLTYLVRQTKLTDLHSARLENAPQLAHDLVLANRRRSGKAEYQQWLPTSTHTAELIGLKGTV